MNHGEAALEAWRAGQAAHPGLELASEDFAAYLAEREGSAHGADLYLACACVRGVPHAARRFVTLYIERIPLYLGRRALGADLVKDVQQLLAIRLLVGESGAAPLLASYRGRGSLEGFVRVAAGRLAVDLQRVSARQPRPLDERMTSPVIADDTELFLLKEAFRVPFQRAFEAAIAALPSETRALLRLHYVEGVTTEQLAQQRRVSRPTVVRRLADARAALLDGVTRELAARAGVPEAEVTGLLHLVRSQLDLSMARLLRA